MTYHSLLTATMRRMTFNTLRDTKASLQLVKMMKKEKYLVKNLDNLKNNIFPRHSKEEIKCSWGKAINSIRNTEIKAITA